MGHRGGISVNVKLLRDALIAAGVLTDVSINSSGLADEGPAYSYHTAPDSTPIRLTWSAAWNQSQWDAANAVIQAYNEASAIIADVQARAKDLYDALDAQARVFRAQCKTLLDEINLLRDRLTAQDGAVAAATSLANLQSRWATAASNAPMPDRTTAQARTAIRNNIDGNA